MAYQLEAQEPISTGIKRITREQLDQALTELSDTDNSQGEAVHEARKCLKKTRAVVRLVRDQLGKNYQRENVCFRNAGRRLSDLRDADVLIETLDQLTKHFAASVSSNAFADIRNGLKDHYHEVKEQGVKEHNQIPLVNNTLKTARQRIDSWSIENDWSALKPGLKRVYQRGYKDFSHICKQPTVESLHDWRKRVKYLWYHLEILEPIWAGMIAELANQTHCLANYLGDDHDLAVLHQFIEDHPERFESSTEREALFALIESRRLELQSAAKILGRKIYAEKAKDFVSRVSVYWQAWQDEADRN